MPGSPLDTRVLRAAIYRYADAVIAGEARYPAITSLLKKLPPSVAGVTPGEPIIEGPTNVETAVKAICNLQSSYLLVQGPPGAGKTFTASRAIVNLLAQGKRVGVSSNSHKAINTLLKEVEKLAIKQGTEFRGVKKCSDDDHRFGGQLIEDVIDNETATSDGYDLIAGTVWLFAREELTGVAGERGCDRRQRAQHRPDRRPDAARAADARRASGEVRPIGARIRARR
jgi:hypothetical protein